MFDDWTGKVGVAFITLLGIGFVVLVVAAARDSIQNSARDKRLFAECMLDHKEYQCEAMLRRQGNDTTVIMPMTIPMR